jgi:triosephosphate isomerase (TIM)
MRKPLVVGNWKMNGLRRDLETLLAIGAALDAPLRARVDAMICPPASLLYPAAAACLGSGLAIGAQDCHAQMAGAHTGDVSAPMLLDAGAEAVIIGHSERRMDHGETDLKVRAKLEAVIAQGLTAIFCVGETRLERESGKALTVVRRQIKAGLPQSANAANVVIAYEPVWAIGTGLVASLGDISAMHAEIRRVAGGVLGKAEAARLRLLYGGSVKPDNAEAIFALDEVDGALVGGASLKAADFLAILRAVSSS